MLRRDGPKLGSQTRLIYLKSKVSRGLKILLTSQVFILMVYSVNWFFYALHLFDKNYSFTKQLV